MYDLQKLIPNYVTVRSIYYYYSIIQIIHPNPTFSKSVKVLGCARADRIMGHFNKTTKGFFLHLPNYNGVVCQLNDVMRLSLCSLW